MRRRIEQTQRASVALIRKTKQNRGAVGERAWKATYASQRRGYSKGMDGSMATLLLRWLHSSRQWRRWWCLAWWVTVPWAMVERMVKEDETKKI
ncbi:hypothetical protein NL676_000913 [Syzygium grande]|nr:hypothetical protein NL676_000913 [Syzygium grande]